METFTTNTENIERAVVELIKAIGEAPSREGLIDTPRRIAKMYKEIFRGYNPACKPHVTTFDNDDHFSGMIFDSGEYYSMCEHHMLPFFGRYDFAYVPDPNGRILGISKVARVVGYCAARLQLQERLAKDIINMLNEALGGSALGMAIVMKGKHLCKSMRGVRNGGEMTVSYMTGVFENDDHIHQSFLSMVGM